MMGRNDTLFRASALTIIQQHYPNITQADLDQKLSKNAQYLSLTLNIVAQNQPTLDALYRDLSASPNILMVL